MKNPKGERSCRKSEVMPPAQNVNRTTSKPTKTNSHNNTKDDYPLKDIMKKMMKMDNKYIDLLNKYEAQVKVNEDLKLEIQIIKSKLEIQIIKAKLEISEIWLYKNEVDVLVINGYSAAHACQDMRAGGVAIYIKQSIKFIEQNNVGGVNQYNMVGVNLQVNDVKIIAFYRPAAFSVKEFPQILEEILQQEKKTLIIGD